MLHYFRVQGTAPKVPARLTAMTALMDENRFQEALDVAEDLLEEDFLLNRRLFTRVLATAATKARRNGLAVKLLRKCDRTA